MINIHVPRPGNQEYLWIDSMLWGPLSPDGKSVSQTLTHRSPFDQFSQGKEFHGENDVSHSKAEGDIYYNPLLVDAIPSNTPGYPHELTFTINDGSSKRQVKIPKGLAQITSVYRNDLGNWPRLLISECSPTKLVIYQVGGSSRSGYWEYMVISKTEYTVLGRPRSYEIEIQKDVEERIGYYQPYQVLLNRNKTLSSVMSLFGDADPLRKTSVKQRLDKMNHIHTGSFSPQSFMKFFLPDQIPQFAFDNSDLEHFGHLADRAVSKMNRTSSNLIEFLSEMRKPKKLIPKLKNLKSLKGYSEEYLRTSYGILPSISDLQSIFSMFAGKKPYFDKNGFQTYHAGDSQIQSLPSGTIEKSRQIKVAVQYENQDLFDILTRVEEIGLMPNAQNLWDLVPFSFVLDWFVDVGGFLERTDMKNRINRLDIPYVTMSDRMSKTISLTHNPKVPVYGELTWVSYQRWTTGRCPTPPLLSGKQSTNPDRSHWIEAGALIVATRK